MKIYLIKSLRRKKSLKIITIPYFYFSYMTIFYKKLNFSFLTITELKIHRNKHFMIKNNNCRINGDNYGILCDNC